MSGYDGVLKKSRNSRGFLVSNGIYLCPFGQLVYCHSNVLIIPGGHCDSSNKINANPVESLIIDWDAIEDSWLQEGNVPASALAALLYKSFYKSRNSAPKSSVLTTNWQSMKGINDNFCPLFLVLHVLHI